MSTSSPHPEQPATPRALVVVESMFGNSAAVGRAVADGLRLEGVAVETMNVSDAPSRLPEGLDLLVLGAPTHAFSLSRASTRADAVRQGAPESAAPVGLREWLDESHPDGHLPLVAVFDTRVAKVRRLPMAAGPTAARMARKQHFAALAKPAYFLVADTKGPLVEGELERAVAWGRELGSRLGVAEGVTGRRP